MPCDFSAEKDFLLVRYSGEITFDEIQTSRADFLGYAAGQGLRKVLIDITDLTRLLSPTELRLAIALHADSPPPRPHIAVVGQPEQMDHLAVVEGLAVSRGMPLKVFASRKAAIAWFED